MSAEDAGQNGLGIEQIWQSHRCAGGSQFGDAEATVRNPDRVRAGIQRGLDIQRSVANQHYVLAPKNMAIFCFGGRDSDPNQIGANLVVITECGHIEVQVGRRADTVHLDPPDSPKITGEYRLDDPAFCAETFKRPESPRQCPSAMFHQVLVPLLNERRNELLKLILTSFLPGGALADEIAQYCAVGAAGERDICRCVFREQSLESQINRRMAKPGRVEQGVVQVPQDKLARRCPWRCSLRDIRLRLFMNPNQGFR